MEAQTDITRTDVDAFVACLKIWTEKGYTVEQAITRHRAQMRRFANNAWEMAQALGRDPVFVGQLYDDLRAKAAS